MPRIRLAFWHDGHQPGDEIDVSAEDLAALDRDGRVAAVIESPQSEPSLEQKSVAEEKPAEKPSRRR